MQVKTTQGLSEMFYRDILTVFKFYSKVWWPQGRITHENLKKLDKLSRTCDSACPPFFRNIAPRHFTGISTPIKISQFPKKKNLPPQLLGFQNASGCQNRLKITKILKEFISTKLKNALYNVYGLSGGKLGR